jgi:hypothetical protein
MYSGYAALGVACRIIVTYKRETNADFGSGWWEVPALSVLHIDQAPVLPLSWVRRWANRIGNNVIRMTKKATTLVTGLSRGRVSWLKIHIGKVAC